MQILKSVLLIMEVVITTVLTLKVLTTAPVILDINCNLINTNVWVITVFVYMCCAYQETNLCVDDQEFIGV